MPRPTLPPTPGSLSDIKGKDGPHFTSIQLSFELPAPAITVPESRPSSASINSSSGSSYHPASPRSPAIQAPRRRSSAAIVPAKDPFTLPPPPSRSRKIIQMKPKAPREEMVEQAGKELSKDSASATQPKKKQPSATSVAGRKIARKTAHSLIERRRRSKMNEEFGVLKDMIPACTGEMHKLAILQASIDYVRYLEDCIAKLKENNYGTPTPSSAPKFVQPFTMRAPLSPSDQYGGMQEEAESGDEDVEMLHDSASHSPTHTTAPPPAQTQKSSTPPTPLLNQEARDRQSSYSSIITDPRRYSGYSTSATTSPAFGPQGYEYAASNSSAFTSPALLPQRDASWDLDQEATTALLMLNTDRRSAGTNLGVRGMSVKDLLST